MLEETGRFECEASDGRRFTVVERREVLYSVFDGKRQKRFGSYDYCLSTGEDVSPLADEEFYILPDGPEIRRIR
jgi:hypothetical protein